jgi:hypothetical protein
MTGVRSAEGATRIADVPDRRLHLQRTSMELFSEIMVESSNVSSLQRALYGVVAVLLREYLDGDVGHFPYYEIGDAYQIACAVSCLVVV